MYRILFLIIGIFACYFPAWTQPNPKSDRPNIIFIMSDGHAYQAISAYDNKLIETPNIDRIAKMGMLFTQASVTNSICAPSRATILTGKHSHLNGKIDNHFPFDTTNVTFPQLLQKADTRQRCLANFTLATIPKALISLRFCLGRAPITIRTLSPKMRATSE